jgi:hypothetical protein
MEGLIRHGVLHARTMAMEWLMLGGDDAPVPPNGYVVAFVPFLERGLLSPPHRFLRGLLHHYGIELQHLNPNEIQHIAAFVTLCKGYLGIEPHFELWRYFFAVSLLKKRERNKPNLSVLMECTGIHLQSHQANEYMSLQLSRSNKGWHAQWFYLKNDTTAPLLEFTGRLIEPVP